MRPKGGGDRLPCGDSFGAMDAFYEGLGWLNGSACPHYDGEIDRRPAYHRAIANGLPDGYAVDDGVALHFVGEQLAEVVSSCPAACAYRVCKHGSEVVEAAITARFLGG